MNSIFEISDDVEHLLQLPTVAFGRRGGVARDSGRGVRGLGFHHKVRFDSYRLAQKAVLYHGWSGVV